MKKLAKGIMYAGGIAGAFVAGMAALAFTQVWSHYCGNHDGDFIYEDDNIRYTAFCVQAYNFEPGTYPAIVEIKEKL